MENIQQAIVSALEAKPLDFKAHIQAELQSRVGDMMALRKQEIAGSLFNQQSEEEDDQSSLEDNADEDL